MTSVPADPAVRPRRRWVPDILGLAWTVGAVVVVMAPLLRPQVALGSFDLLAQIGLTHTPGVRVHDVFPADQVLQFAPWTNLAWTQVHQGHLPLWNPDNVLGTPLAFNWQSQAFSLPALVSYLVPVRYAYTVIVLVKLIVAGTGAYTLCRVLGLGALSAAFGATSFELAGPILHNSPWAMTGVTVWSGWIFTAAILLIGGAHRLRDTAFLAAGIALAVYGGHPESFLVLTLSVAVFLAVFLGTRAVWHHGALRRPVLDLAVATVCGLGLGAPLLFPGGQLVGSSARNAFSGASGFPLAHLTDILVGVQGTDFRLPPPYIGVFAVALALVGARATWRRPEMTGFVGVAVVAVVVCFQSPLYGFLRGLPVVGTETWNRDVMLLALALAVLSAAGVEAVMGSASLQTVRRWAVGAFGASGLVVGGLALAIALGVHRVAPHQAGRFVWPAVEVGVGMGVAVVLGRAWSRGTMIGRLGIRRALGGVLLGVQSAFLITTGVSLWSLSTSYFSPTPAIVSLEHAVGQSMVGIGPCRTTPFSLPYSKEVGIRPDANIGYGVHEFAVYDATIPDSYFTLWSTLSSKPLPAPLRKVGVFCPQITTATQARVFGVGFVLEPRHARGPTGAVFDRMVGTEQLFRIPGAAPATLISTTGGEALSIDTPGTPVAVTHPEPSTWRLHVEGSGPALLRLRLTDVPGWHATIDGKPLSLEPWAQATMLEAKVPAGSHVVELHYWPDLFSVGIVIAVVVAVGLAAAGGIVAVRTRRGRRPPIATASP